MSFENLNFSKQNTNLGLLELFSSAYFCQQKKITINIITVYFKDFKYLRI